MYDSPEYVRYCSGFCDRKSLPLSVESLLLNFKIKVQIRIDRKQISILFQAENPIRNFFFTLWQNPRIFSLNHQYYSILNTGHKF